MEVSFVRIRKLEWGNFTEDHRVSVDILLENRVSEKKKTKIFDLFDLTPAAERKTFFEFIYDRLMKPELTVNWIGQSDIGRQLKKLGHRNYVCFAYAYRDC